MKCKNPLTKYYIKKHSNKKGVNNELRKENDQKDI